MTKEKLVEKIRELLKTDGDLNFLLILEKEELERLVACTRVFYFAAVKLKRKGGNYVEKIVTVPYDYYWNIHLAAWKRLFEA